MKRNHELTNFLFKNTFFVCIKLYIVQIPILQHNAHNSSHMSFPFVRVR